MSMGSRGWWFLLAVASVFLFVALFFSHTTGGAAQVEQHGRLDQQLMVAVDNGDAGLVERLLDQGAPIEAKDASGFTPLTRAAQNGSTAIVKLLLGRGANVAAQDKNGETALLHASRNGDAEIVEALLARTMDERAKEQALFEALGSGPANVVMLDSLGGAPAPKMDEPPWVKTVKLLLDSGVAVDARDEEKSTPLIVASAHGQQELVELLLARGAVVDARDKYGNTALIAAACECAQATMRSTYDILKLLLAKGANVNARTKNGRTALMNAAGGFGSADMVTLLLDRGADPRAKDAEGKTALNYALRSEKTEAAEVLRRAMGDTR